MSEWVWRSLTMTMTVARDPLTHKAVNNNKNRNKTVIQKLEDVKHQMTIHLILCKKHKQTVFYLVGRVMSSRLFISNLKFKSPSTRLFAIHIYLQIFDDHSNNHNKNSWPSDTRFIFHSHFISSIRSIVIQWTGWRTHTEAWKIF